jgi:hypothetical protein
MILSGSIQCDSYPFFIKVDLHSIWTNRNGINFQFDKIFVKEIYGGEATLQNHLELHFSVLMMLKF